MKELSILTLHPQGKNGREIAKEKYDMMKDAILSVLRGHALTHTELMDAVEKALHDTFPGNISWYAETVKLDLEARKLITRTKTKPQKYTVE